MKIVLLLAGCMISVLGLNSCRSGLVTMSNGCYKSIEKGKEENKQGNYQAALDIFEGVLKKCKSFDAREAGNAGKAAALNGLERYDEALAAAGEGLKYKSNSIDLLFEKAMAELGLGQVADAKGDLLKITELTQKNEHLAQKAGIYAKMAELDIRQKTYGNAVDNVQQAIRLDPSNPSFYMLLGDAYSAQEAFTSAKEQYERAIQKGKDDAEAWKAKTFAAIKYAQKKYHTADSELLAGKMSAAEKQELCSIIENGKSKGVKDINIDLLQISVCR